MHKDFKVVIEGIKQLLSAKSETPRQFRTT